MMIDVDGAALRESAPANLDEYVGRWEACFDRYSESVTEWHARNAGYHEAIAEIASFHIPPGASVLELGSGTGDLLAAVRPCRGLGIDVSGAMVRLASGRHPHLRFLKMPAERLELPGETFDYVILSDLLGFLYDIRETFERVCRVCHSRTRVVIHWYSRLWQPVLALAEALGWKYPLPLVNWTTPWDVGNLLDLAGLEVVHERGHILLPKRVPLLSRFANRFLSPLPFFRWFCLSHWIVARPVDLPPLQGPPRVSVICPCRNEAGNIEHVVRRLPRMGSRTELIFVEGHSRDGTLAECQRLAREVQDLDVRVLVQKGIGKGDAVRLGFSEATGDVLVILDADLSVAPEDVPQFLDLVVQGRGELLNGSRAVYPMDPEAMRFLNILGNRAFALLMRVLLGHEVKDTLCGTKALMRSDYMRISAGRRSLGELDPFGDFDLLFGAARLDLKIIDVPVRYRSRIYGQTNIRRFTDGLLLLRMCMKASLRLLFAP